MPRGRSEKGAEELPGKKETADSEQGKGQEVRDPAFYKDLARSFLRNNNIPLHQENQFMAEVLFQVSDREAGQTRVSALKVLLGWGGHLNPARRGARVDEEEATDNIPQEEAFRLICRNLKEMGVTREQMGKWMS